MDIIILYKCFFFFFFLSVFTVGYAGRTVIFPETSSVIEHTPLRLDCFYEGSDSPTACRWSITGAGYGNNTLIAFINQNCSFKNNPHKQDFNFECKNDTANSMYINSTSRSLHGTVFGCSFITEKDHVQERSTVHVIVPVSTVKLTRPDTDIIITAESNTVTFICNASAAYPKPNITWFNDSQTPLDNTDDLEITNIVTELSDDDGYLFTVISNLTFYPTRHDNGSLIYCNASNTGEPSISSSRKALLNIQYPPSSPTFSMRSNVFVKEVAVIKNNPLLIRCKSSGNPMPFYTWKTSQNKEMSGEYLDIRNITEKDDGTFSCMAYNVFETAGVRRNHTMSASVEVSVLFPPESPKFFYITAGISKQVANSTIKVVEGDDFKVLCNSSGKPQPVSVWNGTNSSDILSITSIGADVNNICTCSNVMRETAGAIQNGSESRELNIIALYPPGTPNIKIYQSEVIVDALDMMSVIEDTDIMLECSAVSKPPSTFTWSHHVKKYGNAPSKQLLINHIQRNQSESYTCYVQNEMVRSFGSTEMGKNNRSIYISVLYPPDTPTLYYLENGNKQKINTLPLKVIEGDNVSVFCNATGNPSPMSVWMNGATTKDTFSLDYEEIQHHTNITCISFNMMKDTFGVRENGTSSKIFSISVLHPPRNPIIYIQLLDSTKEVLNYTGILEGSNFSLHCHAVGNPSPSYEWKSPVQRNQLSSDGKLFVSNIQRNQSGPYICDAQNEMRRSFGNNETGRNNQRVYFDILYKAAIKYFGTAAFENNQNMMTINQREDTRIICIVESNPVSNNTIFFNGRLVNETIRSDTITYNLNNSNCSDAGRYTCKGKNEFNYEATANKELLLYVKCLPQPSADQPPEKNVSAPLKDLAVFRFYATPYHDPGITQFRWFKQKNDSRIVLLNDTKTYILSSDIHSVLRITNVSEADYGIYFLEYNNSVGMNNFTFYLHQSGQTVSEEIPQVTDDNNYILVVTGIVVAVLAIVGIISGIVIYRKRFMSKEDSQTGRLIYQNVPFSGKNVRSKLQPKIPKTKETPFQCLQELDDAPPIYREPTEYYNSPEKIAEIDRIKISELFLYVQGMSEDSFGSEFQKLPTELQKPCTFARKPENLALNRYNGVYPYDTSRVKISSEPDFFINACYIDGYAKQNEYIASLGPTSPATYKFKTFWMMVWNEQSDIIVMLTNLREPSGMKCEQYWPEPGTTEVYGDIQVYCEKEDVFAEYTSRVFSVSNAGEKRCVTQLHYTAWPDKKVPEDVTTLIEFRQRIQSIPSMRKGPMIVHCSAGIGRTGTLIALDRLIHEGRSESSINVFKCVNSMREQRVKMVQTMEQYIYIYKALVNSLYFDSEVIPLESFQEYVDATNNNIYSKQFQQLKESVETLNKAEAEAHAQNERMVDKNRPGADVPGNQYRVYLHLNRNMDDSDYINGVYVNSFKKKDHFIIAQSPLPGTVSDFVCMMYQENCCCVVTLEDLKEPGMSVGHYLPTDGHSIRFGGINISCTILETKPHYTVREIRMNNGGKLKSGEKIAYHFQYNKWMQGNDTPTDVQEFVNFVKIVDEYADQLGEEQSHVLVHCLKANERSAVFSIVAILIEKMQCERQVSVLNTVRHLRTRRRTAITSMEQLRFCYQAVNAYISMLEP